MTGKTLIQKAISDKFFPIDIKTKNSHGKKLVGIKAEAKNASRKVRYNKSYLKEVV